MTDWIGVTLNIGQFALTILIIVWRVSSMLEAKSQAYQASLAQYKLDSQAEAARVYRTIVNGDDEVKKELASLTTSLRASIMAVQAELMNRINAVELHTEREFLSKDTFTLAIADLKNQNRENFSEIKDQLKRLETKIDTP